MFRSSNDKAYVASAPGKVLLAGGYLVLDRKYTGLVFGLSARIHVVVQKNEEKSVTVRSPQFKDAEWRYKITDSKDGKAVDVKQMEDRYVHYLLANRPNIENQSLLHIENCQWLSQANFRFSIVTRASPWLSLLTSSFTHFVPRANIFLPLNQGHY